MGKPGFWIVESVWKTKKLAQAAVYEVRKALAAKGQKTCIRIEEYCNQFEVHVKQYLPKKIKP